MDAGKKTESCPHPRATSNPISSLTFWWVLDIFRKGYKRDLEVDDLFVPLREHKSDYLADKIEKLWNKELVLAAKAKRTPSLMRVIVRAFGFSLMFYGFVLLFMEVVLRISQPLFLGRLIRYFSASNEEITKEWAYLYAGGIILCSALNIFFIHPYMMAVFHVGMKMRVACCSLIYRKSLRLSKTALGQTTVGQVVNLLSNDVNRFDVAVIFVHYLWIGPLETVIVTYLMWREVGVAAVIGVASLLLFIPLQGYLGKRTSTLRLKTANRTDERVRLMNEIIAGIQVIKMYTWERPFAKIVSDARRSELKMIKMTSYIRGIILSFILFTTRIAIFVSVLAFVVLGNHITAEKVFVLTSFFNILRQTMTVFFPQGIAQVAEALVSIQRLQKFMLYDELRPAVLLRAPLATPERSTPAKSTPQPSKTNGVAYYPAHAEAVISPTQKDNMSKVKAALDDILDVASREESAIERSGETDASGVSSEDNELTNEENELSIEVDNLADDDEGVLKEEKQVSEEDKLLSREDSGVSKKDSGVSKKDSGASKEDSGVLEKDSGVSKKDSRVSKEDSGVLEKDSGVSKKDSGVSKEDRISNEEPGVTIIGGNAQWSASSNESTLKDINLKMRPGRLVAVIGPVGAGKTSLLHVILRELPLLSGTLRVNGRLSYASQEPWMFAGSVRQNILFGQPYDKQRYAEAVRVCALKRDFSLLPYGDRTVVGERGISLSGGQRARVNLARAVYKDADIYLLDDPLSAVDTHVGKHLFEDCISGYLKHKTCILVTHQLQYLKHVDQILILKDGRIQAEGTYHELQESGLDFAQLLEPEQSELEEDSSIEEGLVVRRFRSREGSLKSTLSVDDRAGQAEPTEVAEMRTSGHVSSGVYRAYFSAGGRCWLLALTVLLCVTAQLLASAGDFWITLWTNLEESRTAPRISQSYNYSDYDNSSNYDNSSLSSPLPPSPSPTLPFSGEFLLWDENDGQLSTEACISVYTTITALLVAITLWRSFAFFTVCMRASLTLHDRMFTSITRATMYFFNTNTSGRILNRFSKDMGSIDELLPAAMIDCVQIGLSLTGIIIVVAIVNFWLLVPTIAVGVIFYYLRKIYLETSRSVKRLEGITRSPVFAHLNASLQGLTTIRAFEAQAVLEREFDNHQDLHSSAWYIFIASSRAFGFWLDIVCLIYIAIVTLSFLFAGNETYGGNVGLAITQSIGLTGMFQWGMRQSAELENQMTSVERVNEYTTLEAEPPLESTPDKKPPPDWPSKGHIEFVRVYLRYSDFDPDVLKNLNFEIMPQEKVGIVGRTGAGKSSLIAALFRLATLEGQILIDGLDATSVGLHDLRSKLSIIPQEPVLFSGTMRKNLDPFDEFSDAVLWMALEEVELKEAVTELPAGLDSKMSEGGSNFSVGQRQLVCLARAIVRNNKILVLDEATANVDPQTDALIQTTIRRKFATCTVLTIAHRLHTVMDSDKVLVMDAGTMVEFNHPYILLQNRKGFFSQMVDQTGKAMADVLRKVATTNYNKRTKNKTP